MALLHEEKRRICLHVLKELLAEAGIQVGRCHAAVFARLARMLIVFLHARPLQKKAEDERLAAEREEQLRRQQLEARINEVEGLSSCYCIVRKVAMKSSVL